MPQPPDAWGCDMNPEFIPIASFSEFYEAGWRMINGYDLKAGDFAVLMAPPGKRARNRTVGADHRVDRFLRVVRNLTQEGA